MMQSVKSALKRSSTAHADPGGWDPIYGKSPVHFAGKIHSKELQKAIEKVLLLI